MAKVTPQPSKRRWSAQEARAVLEKAERSGLSVQRFAQGEGLLPERLYRWQRKLREGSSARFVEMARAVMDGVSIEVALPSGLVVRFPQTARVEVIGRLVATLGQELSC
jgi:transposase-like protein